MRAIILALALLVAPAAAQPRDGAHDFDWEAGRWETRLRYLANPLSPEPDRWVDYRGTSVIRPVMNGAANLVELDVATAAGGRICGVSLRLYNRAARQWSLNFASVAGTLTAPSFGGFDAAGRGVFFGTDTVNDRVVLVRFVITRDGHDRARFVQSYSADGGATWEDNWIADDRRE